jgi:hypothetical protein
MTNQLFDRATAAATCNFLSTSGSAALSYAAWGLVTPGPFDEFGALAYAGLAGVAYAAGCTWDPDQTGPTGGNTFGCVKKAAGTSNAIVRSPCTYSPGDPNYLTFCSIYTSGFQEIVSVREIPNANGPTVSRYEIDVFASNGDFVTLTKDQNGNVITLTAGTKFSLYGDGACLESGDDLPDEFIYDYTDTDTGCELTVEMLGYAVDGAGRVSPAWQLTKQEVALRSNGGVISGDCNFAPTVVIPPFGGPPGGGGNGNGPTYLPLPPDGTPSPITEPWWIQALREIAAGVIAQVIASEIQEIFATQYAGLIYRMVSVCETDAGGEPISESVDVSIPALKAPDAQIARLDAIVELLQAAKNFKQPVCPPDRPALLGDWVTVRFESIENSPQGTRPLRKLFRYRSQSALDLGQIAAYWENFTWIAGPVCVQHKNASWGTPQCWAANVDEGKRVIRFAGLEAGIDPDVVGEWVISGSSDPRFGMPGTMQVAQVQGLDWITSREGPSGPPLLTVDP